MRALNLLANPECLLGMSNHFGLLAKFLQRQAHVPMRAPFPAPVPYLSCDLQVLFVILDGPGDTDTRAGFGKEAVKGVAQ